MKSVSRRTLLRGAGATLGLPWLEVMAAPSRLLSKTRRMLLPMV